MYVIGCPLGSIVAGDMIASALGDLSGSYNTVISTSTPNQQLYYKDTKFKTVHELTQTVPNGVISPRSCSVTVLVTHVKYVTNYRKLFPKSISIDATLLDKLIATLFIEVFVTH